MRDLDTGRRAPHTAQRTTPLDVRRERRTAMRGVPERRSRCLTQGEFEFRANPTSAGGPTFRFEGYASVCETPFQMFDPWGDPYSEIVAAGAFTRTLGGNPDVPLLIGHQDDLGSKIPLARSRSGSLQLMQDTTGLLVVAPALDGRRADVQALASAMAAGDLDEMSMAFIARQQMWSPDYEQRRITEVDIHRGDVCILAMGANPATAGASMTALPVGEAAARRQVGERRTPTAPYSAKPGETAECPQCHSMNDTDAAYCDQCGTAIMTTTVDSTAQENETQRCPCGSWNSDDAKFCSSCGINLASDLDADNGGPGNGIDTVERSPLWAARDPRRDRRAGGPPADAPQPDFAAKPPHDADAHGEDSPACPNPQCGAANASDAAYCDQCGTVLYDDGGLVQSGGATDDLVSDASGIVEEDDEMALAAARGRARVRVLQLGA